MVSLFIKLSEDLDFLKYFTLNTLFDTTAILEGNGYGASFAAMAGLSAVLYVTGMVWFQKRICRFDRQENDYNQWENGGGKNDEKIYD